jgi:hypothetical protein
VGFMPTNVAFNRPVLWPPGKDEVIIYSMKESIPREGFPFCPRWKQNDI